MDNRAVSVDSQDDNAMRLNATDSHQNNATIALRDEKTPVSLEKQDLQSITQSMRLTQCVTHDWKIGNCEHCNKEYEKKVTWQKFCNDDCRIANWEVTHGKKFKKKVKQS